MGDLLSLPEQKVDIGLWALIIARKCDSSVDVNHYLRVLDSMAAAIRYMVGPRDGDMVRFMMTKMYQFETGTWNGGRIFRYDLDDPMGEKPSARLLSTYLDTRKGNCVSMPTLFLALMERVDPDIPFYGVSTPLHLFCRYHDRQDGQVWNVEATNGGNSMRDVWVIEQFGISQVSIDSGVYMRDLTKKEYVAELIGGLVSLNRQTGQFKRALELTDLMLVLNPNSVIGLVHKGAISAWLGYELDSSLAKANRKPTPEEFAKIELYREDSRKYIGRATMLGWRPETQESQERYLGVIKAAKKQH
ncbi:MAG: hypothetical protein NTV06_01570 [candidate division Zixibacteria bacterium]|nr:hypothetical protein [candidate division Zixibacteria bacterium]